MFSKIQKLIKNEKNKNVEEVFANEKTKPEETNKNNLNFKFNYIKPNIKDFQVPNLKTVYYLPSIIDKETEQNFLNCFYSSENNKRWVNLSYSNRRLQKFGGEVTKEGLTNKEELPDFLQKLAAYLMENELFPPKEEKNNIKLNHCLVNEYQNGIGIMPHTDGPLYYPYVMILSLGSHCSFNFYEDYSKYKNEEAFAKLFIEPRSLLIFTDECYSKILHCIEDKISDEVFIKWDSHKNCLLGSNYSNILLTDYWKNLSMDILQKNGFIEENFKRNKRISVTIRHVPEKM